MPIHDSKDEYLGELSDSIEAHLSPRHQVNPPRILQADPKVQLIPEEWTIQVIFNGPVNAPVTIVMPQKKETNTLTVGPGGNVSGVAQGSGKNVARGGAIRIGQQREPIDEQLEKLEGLVQEMLQHLQGAEAAKAKNGLDAIKLKAKATPEDKEKNREWYSVSTKGLLEAAGAVAKVVPAIGTGVTETLRAISNLIGE